jgi:hypothetical protein
MAVDAASVFGVREDGFDDRGAAAVKAAASDDHEHDRGQGHQRAPQP